MKIYKTQEEVTADIKDGVLAIKGDVRFECDISIRASIVVTKGDLNCWSLDCLNLDCLNLTCENLTCENLNCRDLTCWDIDCLNLKCWDIDCFNLNCLNLSYYARCFAYYSITCTSYKARREVHQEPMCLEGELTIVKKEDDATREAIKLLESNGYTISK